MDLSPSPYSIYDMPGIQWTYPRAPIQYTTCLGYSGPIPEPLFNIRHAWDTVDLSPSPYSIYDMPGIQWTYPRAPNHLIRHAWDTVDLSPSPYSLYDMPGIQWTYPRAPIHYTTCLGQRWIVRKFGQGTHILTSF